MSDQARDIDLFGMPLEGVAAYWLSLKKLVGGSRNFKVLVREAEFTAEPFIHHLLDLAFNSRVDDAHVRAFASIKGDVICQEQDKRLDLMRIAVMDVVDGENPHRTYARMAARLLAMPIDAERALTYAQELLRLALEKEPSESYFIINNRHQDDKLIVTLLFYVVLARHHGRIACRPFMEHQQCRFFGDALSLVVDGFDAPFVRKWMKRHKDILLADLRHKMSMSIELCIGMRNRMDYEDIYRAAQSFIR